MTTMIFQAQNRNKIRNIIALLFRFKWPLPLGISFCMIWIYFKSSSKPPTCDFAFTNPVFGEWFEEKNIEKSEIPVVYYFNGNEMPEWGLLNIRNTLRFHKKVYFVSRDGLTVNFDGVM
jgi:hypothetical protein